MRSLAKDRAAFILEMAEADEAQRNIKPLPETAFEARRMADKAFAKLVRDDIWHTITLPKLMGEWKAAREENEQDPVYHRLAIRAAIEERRAHGKYILDESLTATERRMDRNFYAVSFNPDGTIHTADECGPWRIVAWAFGNRQLKQPWTVLAEGDYYRLLEKEGIEPTRH